MEQNKNEPVSLDAYRERREARAVPPMPPVVLRRGLGHLMTMQALPDNVFYLRNRPPESPDAA